MHVSQWRAERERLCNLLESYESGRVKHYDEDETGQLRRDTTAEQIASVRERIARLDRQLSESSGA